MNSKNTTNNRNQQPSKLKFMGSNCRRPGKAIFISNVLMLVSYTCLIMMTKAKVKCWGNSLGVVLPKTLVEEEGLKEGEEVEITVRKVSDVRRLRGKYPFKE